MLSLSTLNDSLLWHPATCIPANCRSLSTLTDSLHWHPATCIHATGKSISTPTDSHSITSVCLSALTDSLFWRSAKCITMNMASNVSRRSSRNLPRLNYVNMSVREDKASLQNDNRILNWTENNSPNYPNSGPEIVSNQNGTELNISDYPGRNTDIVLNRKRNGTESNSPDYPDRNLDIASNQKQDGIENDSPDYPDCEIQHRDYTLDKAMKKNNR